MPNDCTTYVAFIDLLAMKHLSKDSPKEYKRITQHFGRGLLDNFKTLGIDSVITENEKLFFFSDCAYIQTGNIDSLLSFLKNLSSYLFASKGFFKGGVAKGCLYPEPAFSNNSIFEELYVSLEKYTEHINGVFFNSENMIDAYDLQTNLKGVGISIHPNIVSNIKDKNLFIKNIFILHKDKLEFAEYYDIKMAFNLSNDTGDYPALDAIDFFLTKALESTVQGSKYDKYYFSIICNIILSTDFFILDLQNVEERVNELFTLTGKYKKLFERIPWLMYIPIKILDILKDDEEYFNCAVDIMYHGNRELKKMLESCVVIQQCLLSSTSKKLILKALLSKTCRQ